MHDVSKQRIGSGVIRGLSQGEQSLAEGGPLVNVVTH